jgi:hypothetical protein
MFLRHNGMIFLILKLLISYLGVPGSDSSTTKHCNLGMRVGSVVIHEEPFQYC